MTRRVLLCILRLLKGAGGAGSDDRVFFGMWEGVKTAEYIMDVYKLSSCISEHEAKRAGAEIVKQSDSAPLSSLLLLDEQYLDCDAEFGGKLHQNPYLPD